MLIDEELRGLKRFYLEIISFIEKLGKSREGSKESPEQIGWMIREKLKRAEMSLERLFIELDDVEDEEKRLKYKNVSDRLKEDLKMYKMAKELVNCF
ncbi:hypothetical protein T552_00448 [Pneumocystis carinii B80]|uniref:Uncharacterized protein n=1 Tax=Pneumocystis carinii (strain B80) TaxID=1408658 RepID=A0A0W4ZQV3_PNEC8|nr:hypothetical protein T552_00448 [Pneumocystis carinii B80]KTW30736.1 hypothetical protein T552_00448 [Pneumocystis carinii B80]